MKANSVSATVRHSAPNRPDAVSSRSWRYMWIGGTNQAKPATVEAELSRSSLPTTSSSIMKHSE